MDSRVEFVDGIFIGTSSGEAEVDGIELFLESVVSHEKWKPGSLLLHDLSNFDSGPLSLNDIKRMADFGYNRRAQFGAGKIAIVAIRDLEYGLARMLSVFVDDKLDTGFEVFRSRKEAFAWLSA